MQLARHDRHASPSREPLARTAEFHEPIELPTSPVAAEILTKIDLALDSNSMLTALQLERRLPTTLGAEPAIVDRLVTLRLMTDDVATAAAGLGACPERTPRLDLLRAIVLVRWGDHAALAAVVGGAERAAPARRVLGALVDRVVEDRKGYRPCGDPTVAVCDAVSGLASPVATLISVFGLIETLLGTDAEECGTLAGAVAANLRSVARDLGIASHPRPRVSGLEVTPSDRHWLTLRGARAA